MFFYGTQKYIMVEINEKEENTVRWNSSAWKKNKNSDTAHQLLFTYWPYSQAEIKGT